MLYHFIYTIDDTDLFISKNKKWGSDKVLILYFLKHDIYVIPANILIVFQFKFSLILKISKLHNNFIEEK